MLVQRIHTSPLHDILQDLEVVWEGLSGAPGVKNRDRLVCGIRRVCFGVSVNNGRVQRSIRFIKQMDNKINPTNVQPPIPPHAAREKAMAIR